MTKKERFTAVTAWFSENMPAPQTELHYTNPFQLLIAVILSAQCTDKRVNMTVPPLFERFPTPESLAEARSDGVGKRSNRGGVTRFTRRSVHWADRMTATRSWKVSV